MLVRAGRRLVALVAAVALLGGACGSDGGTDVGVGGATKDEINAAAPADGVLSRSIASTFEIEVTGAVESRWVGTVPVNVLTLVSAEVEKAAWLLQVGLLEPVEATNGFQLRPAFDLVGYSGDGSYEIAPTGDVTGGGLDGSTAAVLDSTSFVVIGTGDDDFEMHGDLVASCSVTSIDKGFSGRIECPQISGPRGEIAVKWSWEGIEVIGTSDRVDPSTGAAVVDDPVVEETTAPETTEAPAAQTQTSEPKKSQRNQPKPIKVNVTLSSSCVTPGQRWTVTIDTVAEATIAAAVAFSDAKTYGLQRIDDADSDGRLVWEMTIPAEAPEGEGNVLVAATAPDQRSGSKIQPFELKLLGC